MKINLKDNIWIEGFAIGEKSKLYDKILELGGRCSVIYDGKTSEIPEEIARECVNIEYFGEYWQGMWQYSGYRNFNINSSHDYVHTARESIQSACNNELYCIIWKE